MMTTSPFISPTSWPGHHRTLAAIAIALCTLNDAAADDVADVEQDVQAIMKHADMSTFMAGIVHPDAMQLPPQEKLFDLLPLTGEARQTWIAGYQQAQIQLNLLKQASAGQRIYFAVGIPYSKSQVQAVVFRASKDAKQDEKLAQQITDESNFTAKVEGSLLILRPDGMETPQPLTPSKQWRGDFARRLTESLQATRGLPVQVSLLPPQQLWNTMRDLSPELPKQLGGGPSHVLTNVHWAGFGANLPEMMIRVVVRTEDEQAATAFAQRLPSMLSSLVEAAEIPSAALPAPVIKLLLGMVQFRAVQNEAIFELRAAQAGPHIQLLTMLSAMLQSKWRASRGDNELKQILLGMHNYHDTHGAFPPDEKARDENGAPRLSWRVHVLPFVDEMALYQQFHLDEPWDSEHNKKLIPQMPKVFAPTSPKGAVKPGHTTIQAPVGKGTVFGHAKPTQIQNVIDGTSNTAVVVEVKPELAVPWTSPQDYKFDPKDPMAGIVLVGGKHWRTAFADGSVHRLSAKLSAETVLHLFQMNDGHPVDPHPSEK